MAASQLSIYNMAIGMVAGTRAMSLADDETGLVEVALLNELWPTAVDDVIAGRDWSFARKVAMLTPVPDPLTTLGQNRACYAVPIDSATIRQIGDSLDFDPGYEWEIQGQIIVVQAAVSAVLWVRYTRIVRETALFDGPFTACLVARLGFELALPIANSKPLFDKLYGLYIKRLGDSTITNAMQGKRTPFAPGRLTRARNR